MRLLTLTLAAAVAYAALSALELSEARAEIAVLKLKNERLFQQMMTMSRRETVRRIREDRAAQAARVYSLAALLRSPGLE